MRPVHPSYVIFLAAVILLSAVLLAADPTPVGAQGTPTPFTMIEAVVAVERAIVFPLPDRNSEPLTYIYQRERVPIFGKTADGEFLWVRVGDLLGWILSAQADISGDPALIPVIGIGQTPVPTASPAQVVLSPSPAAPLPTSTSLPVVVPGTTPTPQQSGTPAGQTEVLPGSPPPLNITLPQDWKQLHLLVPVQTFDNVVNSVPLTIYFGPLPGGANGFIYLYWGFPNVVDWVSGEYNLWADGVQILRGSLVGSSCNLGVYDQETFAVGSQEGVGAFYQASECEEEANTAGWFVTLRVDNGSYAFYTAVEPWDALSAQRLALQIMLDSVVFLPDSGQ